MNFQQLWRRLEIKSPLFCRVFQTEEKMGRIPNGVYTAKFRSQAVKLIAQKDLSVDLAAKRLSVLKSSLGN